MTDLVDKIASAVPTNWCDPLLTGDRAIFPKGERVPAWLEPMILAIRERVRAEAAALEAAREDAERYRWLRSLDGSCDGPACVNFNIGFDWIEQHGEELDAAIDAARKEVDRE